MRVTKFSLRDVPWTIYVAIAVALAGSLAHFVAEVMLRSDDFESYKKLARWRLLDGACSDVYTMLLPLGFLELAKRQVGTARPLAMAGAALLFANFLWSLVGFVVVSWQPQSEIGWVYEWTGRIVLLFTAAAWILITLGADAWRRVTFAAVILMLLLVTSFSVPIIGREIADLFGKNFKARQVYGLLREATTGTMVIFIAAALAARGSPEPHPMRAVGGFSIARIAIVIRLAAAVMFGLLVLGAKSAGVAKLLAIGIPFVMVTTMLIYSIGLVQVASSRIPGMPRLLFVLGAAMSVWWIAIQFDQIGYLVAMSRDKFSTEDALETLELFSLAGPIVQVVGMVLVGSAIHSFAIGTGQIELASRTVPRLLAFALLMLASVALQSQVFEASTPGKGIALLLGSAITGVAALIMFASLLGLAANAVLHREPAHARVVSGPS